MAYQEKVFKVVDEDSNDSLYRLGIPVVYSIGRAEEERSKDSGLKERMNEEKYQIALRYANKKKIIIIIINIQSRDLSYQVRSGHLSRVDRTIHFSKKGHEVTNCYLVSQWYTRESATNRWQRRFWKVC
jgi:hypothetical protein